MHAYFLRPGNVQQPVDYEVDRIRDGTSFTTRRVVASQSGQAIFHMSASFQLNEPGYTHQDLMPTFPTPDALASSAAQWRASQKKIPEQVRALALSERPIEVVPVDPVDLFEPEPRSQSHAVWLRAVSALPESPRIHHSLLAYASDFAFMPTALRPHAAGLASSKMQVASLDHAIWFHGPCQMDQWHLHVVHSPWAGGARGLVRGSLFNREGGMIASTAQEGLMRLRG
jgi:acyl-CoA thioesterase-2